MFHCLSLPPVKMFDRLACCSSSARRMVSEHLGVFRGSGAGVNEGRVLLSSSSSATWQHLSYKTTTDNRLLMLLRSSGCSRAGKQDAIHLLGTGPINILCTCLLKREGDCPSYLTSGSPDRSHENMPPMTLYTLLNPRLVSMSPAVDERLPLRQYTTMARP